MVRPASFGYNKQTATSNKFQRKALFGTKNIDQQAIQEFDNAVQVLLDADVDIMIIQDTPKPAKPDAVFPNNWLGMLHGGNVHLFPMNAENRRGERDKSIVEQINKRFQINSVTDWSYLEDEEQFLEGTGSMVFDHVSRQVYACLSDRTNVDVLLKFCHDLGYKAVTFHAYGDTGLPIYHTNVMMSIGEGYALYCADAITNEQEKSEVYAQLYYTERDIILISKKQLSAFAGNILQFRNRHNKKCIAISQNAHKSLTASQLSTLEKHGELLVVSIPTIEKYGGGSIRCMLAEVFLGLR
jgi:hypothetical protein